MDWGEISVSWNYPINHAYDPGSLIRIHTGWVDNIQRRTKRQRTTCRIEISARGEVVTIAIMPEWTTGHYNFPGRVRNAGNSTKTYIVIFSSNFRAILVCAKFGNVTERRILIFHNTFSFAPLNWNDSLSRWNKTKMRNKNENLYRTCSIMY